MTGDESLQQFAKGAAARSLLTQSSGLRIAHQGVVLVWVISFDCFVSYAHLVHAHDMKDGKDANSAA
eukprot:1915684-Amphidinium_carterae.1